MKEEEFVYIVDFAAKINAKAYSEKRLADISGTPKIFIWLLILAYSMTFGVFIILLVGSGKLI
jgi:nitrate/nitrite transporter NarK